MVVQEIPISESSEERVTKQRANIPNVPAITSNPERMSGTPVIGISRVPVSTMLDHFAAGYSLDEFLAQFPTIEREKAIAVLDVIKEAVDEGAFAAAIDY
jgi:uncharacterized protein (DUF433 family)